VPPLRERREDIPAMVAYSLKNFSAKGDYQVRAVDAAAMDALTAYRWPGNVRELENVVERLVVTAKSETVTIADLPAEIRAYTGAQPKVMRERRKTIADDLYRRVVHEGESFWTAVYPLYMQREITKTNVREVVRRGLNDARGNYKIVARMFNLDADDYKRFLNFLRKHDCQLPFKEFR